MKKTVVITGAASGIGNGLAEHLAVLQHNVIAVSRNKSALKKLQQANPKNIKYVVADITHKEDQLKVKDAIASQEVGVYLVHNAGVAIPQVISELTEEEWDKHYFTNLKAPVFLTKLLLPYLKNGGRVLNISTGLAHFPLSALASYGISKAGLYMWKEFCNVELRNQGIIFGSVMPGVVDTPMQNNLRSLDSAEFPSVEMFRGFSERGELLRPVTVAKFISWLLFEVEDESFMKGDWNIYEETHHKNWADPGEVKQRK